MGPADSAHYGILEIRAEDVLQGDHAILMARGRSGPFLIVGVRLRLVGVIDLVASCEHCLRGKVVVHLNHSVSLHSDALASEDVLGAVAVDGAIRQRKESKVWPDASGDWHCDFCPARIGAHALAYHPVARVRRQRVRLVGDALIFVQFLVVAKDERPVPDDWSTSRATELVA